MARLKIASILLTAVCIACGGGSTDSAPPQAPVESPPPSSAAPTPKPTSTASSPAPSSPASSTAPSPSASAAGGPKSCKQDTDCTIVETGCCDHCNGGKAEAFNVTVASSQKPTCKQTMCTKRGCAPVSAACRQGTCTEVSGDSH